jgi:hypothetical protein
MRGFQLQEARHLRRAELRRYASGRGYAEQSFLALDADELRKRADLGDVSAQGNAVKRALIVAQLRSVTGGEAAIAEAWRIEASELHRMTSVPLLDPSGIAAAIDAQVLEELPETPEPGRVVAPQA